MTMSAYSLFHKIIFSIISVIYRLFFGPTSKKYIKLVKENLSLLGDPAKKTVLDIGCGTGAFTFALAQHGFNTTGTDISGAMMRKAREKNLICVKGDITAGLPFDDNSFDIVCAAFVAHGLRHNYRMKVYEEARRIARDKVVFHEYNKALPALPILIIEILEILIGGDFFNFRKHAVEEMETVFSSVREETVTKSNSWYICIPDYIAR